MCGIIGAINNIPEKKDFLNARDSIRHRGPDDCGMYYNKDEQIALGHRRLSIIDLSSAGHQPFISSDKRYVLIYNGEIYNYIEIKKELRDSYKFLTKTDTEVLLAAYIKWGEKCIEKFNGMFAFAIWDRRKKELFCARDRVGIKPFYYYQENNSLYFSSEIKALLHLGIRAKPNNKIIFDYLYHGFYDHCDETFFQGIKRLPAGHKAVWRNDAFHISKYWDLAEIKKPIYPKNPREKDLKFLDLLKSSIKLRFRSDVPVGINLSSGLDSNSLLYFSMEILRKKSFGIFSMCNIDKKYNECDLIKKYLNDTIRKEWFTSNLDPGHVFEMASIMNGIQDEPYGGLPTIAYGGMMREAKRKGVTVLLEGQGVDELLAGYKYYLIDRDLDKKKIGNSPNSQSFSQDLTKLIQHNIFNSNFVRDNKREINYLNKFDSHLLNAQYRDIVHAKLPRVLRFNDHVSMAYGRELRLPFLDHRLVEYCFFLPESDKIENSNQKVLLKRAMNEYLPDIVNNKKKISFGAFQTEWLKKYFHQELSDIVSSESFISRKYWDNKKLSIAIDKFYKDQYNNSFFLWQCINLELWFRKYIDN